MQSALSVEDYNRMVMNRKKKNGNRKQSPGVSTTSSVSYVKVATQKNLWHSQASLIPSTPSRSNCTGTASYIYHAAPKHFELSSIAGKSHPHHKRASLL